jgi:hypothetical protein
VPYFFFFRERTDIPTDKGWVSYWAATVPHGTSQTRWISFLIYLVQIIVGIIYWQTRAMYLEHFIMYVTLGTAGIPCIQANIILCEYIYRFGADSIYSIYRHFKEKETLKEDTHKSINDSEGINMEEGNPEEISDDLDTSVTPEIKEASENVSNPDKEL